MQRQWPRRQRRR